ncbi:MAG: 3-dehydroquinate synthase [Acidobacteria bacterium]|nr:3-dehydroquinate synthase [Acidobacteriota bacterium]
MNPSIGQAVSGHSAQITVRVPGASYPVFIETGLLLRCGQILRERAAGRKVFILSDNTVWKLWGNKLLEGLRPIHPQVIRIPAGELYKRMATVEKIAGQLAAQGAERSSLLVAFGGGVVGDIGGFVASIFLRGIDYVQVPTTLLAQVDSSIGGKTGANLAIGKNLVGTFYQPRMVLSDPAVLRTLPDRQLRAGLFEAVKCAVIGDPDLFEFLLVARRSVLGGNPAALEHVIRACAALKGRIVNQDEREGGLRRVLNFGHTLGHAIEAATGYRRFLHGEAIAWGMLAATRLAVGQKLLAPSEAARIATLVVAYGPVPTFGTLRPAALGPHLGVDKKVRDGQIYFVLPRKIGDVVISGGITVPQALHVVEQLMRENPFRAPALKIRKANPPAIKGSAAKQKRPRAAKP